MLSPTRRTFLAIGAMSGAHLLCGCSGDSAHGDPKKPDPDLPLRARAVAATDALLASYDAVPSTDTVQALRADVVKHRAALTVGLPSPSASPSTTASAPAPGAPATTVAALAAAERHTAAARLADLYIASPGLAKLLASVSASDALHAAALGDTGPIAAPPPPAAPSPSASAAASSSAAASRTPTPLPTAEATALQGALAAEHAAVYGYGVVGARLPAGPQREDGHASYAAHQARRDAWQRILSTGGASPTAAAPGYQLPFPVSGPDDAGKLAAHIETQLTAVYAELVAASTGSLRLAAAEALRETALRARHWGTELSALPGIPDSDGATPSSSAST